LFDLRITVFITTAARTSKSQRNITRKYELKERDFGIPKEIAIRNQNDLKAISSE
jgi:hypothetical protein